MLEALRNRDPRLLVERGGVGPVTCMSLAKDGGYIISWVLVSERMKVKSGEGGDGACSCLPSLLVLSFFFRRSLSGIVVCGLLRCLQVADEARDKAGGRQVRVMQ